MSLYMVEPRWLLLAYLASSGERSNSCQLHFTFFFFFLSFQVTRVCSTGKLLSVSRHTILMFVQRDRRSSRDLRLSFGLELQPMTNLFSTKRHPVTWNHSEFLRQEIRSHQVPFDKYIRSELFAGIPSLSPIGQQKFLGFPSFLFLFFFSF
jgi:hypothetical protein